MGPTAIRVVLTLAFSSLATLPAAAQSPAKVPRLCFLTLYSIAERPVYGAFLDGLRHAGYVEGHTITIDYLSADGRLDQFPPLASECLRLQADLIVAATTPGVLAVKHATRTIPIVMLGPGDPVGTGLVESLARPGGNVTGQSSMAPGLSAKRLELLKEVVPRLTRPEDRQGAGDHHPPTPPRPGGRGASLSRAVVVPP